MKDFFTTSSPRRYGSSSFDSDFIPGPVPVPVSIPSYDGTSSVVLPKPPKSTKSWTKSIFKQKANSGLPSYVLPPSPTPIYTPNAYNGGYGFDYASGYSWKNGNYGYSRPIVPPYPPSYPPSYNGYGTYNLPFYPVRPSLLGSSLYDGLGLLDGYQSVPTLAGAFDHYRGPIYYGGFRPTLGPYGGPLYSELLSVTDSYGRPLFPSYSLFDRKTDVADMDRSINNSIQSAAVAALTSS